MRLHVTSEPAGAEVKKEDGTVLGQTPLDTELPADGSMVKISVRKEGFKEEVRAVIVSERDKTLAFTLVSETPHVKPNSVDGPIKPSGAKKTKRPRKLGDDILTPNL